MEEFNVLTGRRKRILFDLLTSQGAPALGDLAFRSPPSHRAQDVDSIFHIIKGLVCLLPGCVFYLEFNGHCQVLIPEVPLRRRWVCLPREE